jgi:hypothetical protein
LDQLLAGVMPALDMFPKPLILNGFVEIEAAAPEPS